MSYKNLLKSGWYLLELKVEDHPGVFLPSGYVRDEVLKWLEEQIAPMTEQSRWLHNAKADGIWQLSCPTATKRDNGAPSAQYRHVLAFKNKDAAMLFKLRWSGVVHASTF